MSKLPNPFSIDQIRDAVGSGRRLLDDIASGKSLKTPQQRAQQLQKSHDDLIALRTMLARSRNAGGAAHDSELLDTVRRIEQRQLEFAAKKSAPTVRRKRTPKGQRTADLKLRARYDAFCNTGRRSIDEFCESEHDLLPREVDRAFDRLRKANKDRDA